jgi:uncharacterized membrane protein
VSEPSAAQPSSATSSRHRSRRHPTLRKLHDERTVGQRVADRVARFGGSWPFIFLYVGTIGAWVLLNTVVLARVVHGQPFDPYPYIALNLVLSALAGLQAPVILMSQNRAAARDEALAEHHYEEGQKVERVLDGQVALLEENTRLTRQVHELSREIRDLTARIHETVSAPPP